MEQLDHIARSCLYFIDIKFPENFRCWKLNFCNQNKFQIAYVWNSSITPLPLYNLGATMVQKGWTCKISFIHRISIWSLHNISLIHLCLISACEEHIIAWVCRVDPFLAWGLTLSIHLYSRNKSKNTSFIFHVRFRNGKVKEKHGKIEVTSAFSTSPSFIHCWTGKSNQRNN